MRTIIVVWADGSEEEVLCYNWHMRDGVITICVNDVTREYRYIVAERIREVRTKR